MKAIILARVSTEEQKEAGNSLPAQQARLRDYIEHIDQLKLFKEFIFDESAYKEHRKEFANVIEFIQSQKESVALCCDKVDRLSRDFLVGLPALEKLRRDGKIELHFPSDNLVLHRESPATDLFHYNIAVSLAQYYSNSISDNVKRAYEQKIRRGEWIGQARIGYINITKEDDSKDIIPDPDKAYYIPKIFEYYIAGTSIRLLAIKMKKEGLRSKNDKPFSASMIHKILMDTFYYGVMIVKGKEYPHKYQPLISYNTFLKAQGVRKSYKKKPFKYMAKLFIFRGLIKCAICGCMITPEFKKGKYILYSCTNFKRTHKKRIYVPEAELLKPIYKVLEALKLPQNKIDELVSSLKASSEAKSLYHEKAINNLDKDYMESHKKTDKLLDLLLAGSITQDIYDAKFKKEKDLQSDILYQKEEHTDADTEYHITARTVLSLAKRSLEIFEGSEIDEKRQFLNYLLQNCQLRERKLEFTLRNPFNLIADYSSYPTLLPG